MTTSPLLLERADRVLLLDSEVVASGTHLELLQGEPRYRSIVLRGTEANMKPGASPAETGTPPAGPSS
jgi:hypothetical protein